MANETSISGNDLTAEERSDFQKKDDKVDVQESVLTERLAVRKDMNWEDLWKEDLQKDIDINLVATTHTEYLKTCNKIQKCLQGLLANEMTSAYADVSTLLKKFRSAYAYGSRLLRKVLEIETERRSLEKLNKSLAEQLDEQNVREKRLRDSYDSVRNTMADIIKQKHDVEVERDELRSTIPQAPKNEAADEDALAKASEENNLLRNQVRKLKEKVLLMEEDLELSQKCEATFRGKYEKEKALRASLEKEIVVARRNIVLQDLLKETAELNVSKNSNNKQEYLLKIKELENDILELQKEIEDKNNAYNRTFKEVHTLKEALQDSEFQVKQCKKTQFGKDFQIASLKAIRDKLNDKINNCEAEIHSLTVQSELQARERNQNAKKHQKFEEDIRRLKCSLEETEQTIKQHLSYIDHLQKKNEQLEKDNNEITSQFASVDTECRTMKGIIRILEKDKASVERKYESALKERRTRVLQIVDLENAIKKSREEKISLNGDINDLKNTISELLEKISALEQKCVEGETKVLQLKKQIQSEKERFRCLNDIHKQVENQYRSAKEELEHTKSSNSVVCQRSQHQLAIINRLEEEQVVLKQQITTFKTHINSFRSAEVQAKMRCNELSDELRQKDDEKLFVSREVAEKEKLVQALRRKALLLARDLQTVKLQLDAKTDEAKLKDEAMKLKEMDLLKLEQELQDRINDIKLLKTEIENLHRKQELLKKQSQDVKNLRNELNSVHRQLTEEKLKSSAMEEEFQKPQNIHRWRKLESDDPAKAELIEKNIKITKILTEKVDELKHKETELQSKSHRVDELQQNMLKIAQTKANESTWKYKKELQECKERIKCLTGEVFMYENLTSRLQIEKKELMDKVNRLKISAHENKLPPIKASE